MCSKNDSNFMNVTWFVRRGREAMGFSSLLTVVKCENTGGMLILEYFIVLSKAIHFSAMAIVRHNVVLNKG